MSALFDAARDLQTLLETRGWRFCFIGGLAAVRWGEPRFTRGVDVTCCVRLEARTRYPRRCWTRDTCDGSRMPGSLPVEIESCSFNRLTAFRLISLWRRSRLRKSWWNGIGGETRIPLARELQT
jgi:hypothetical protein